MSLAGKLLIKLCNSKSIKESKYGLSFKSKAKKGDYIQAFNSEYSDRGFNLGKVTKIEIDKKDGVEYVYYKAEISISADNIAKKLSKEFRIPNNGIDTSMGNTTNFINVL